MAEFSVSIEDDVVTIECDSPSGKKQIQMDARLALKLAASILVRARNSGDEPTETALRQNPLLFFRNPALELGADEEGNLLVAFQALSLPPFWFSIDEDSAHVIAKGAKEILSVPRDMRVQLKRHQVFAFPFCARPLLAGCAFLSAPSGAGLCFGPDLTAASTARSNRDQACAASLSSLLVGSILLPLPKPIVPFPDHRDRLYQAIGEAITRWQYIETWLYLVAFGLMGTDQKTCSLAFFQIKAEFFREISFKLVYFVVDQLPHVAQQEASLEPKLQRWLAQFDKMERPQGFERPPRSSYPKDEKPQYGHRC